MKFEEYSIPQEIKKGLQEAGLKRPTDIQYKCIQPILNKEDVLAIAQTGTGKTAAFVIPILTLLQESKHKNNNIKCLVMVPTRELAVQINDVFEKLGKYTKIKSFALYGGVEQDTQISTLSGRVDILIATPGRMFDLAHQGHLNLNNVEILVLDEADHMLDLGFIRDIKAVKQMLTKKHQTLFFSATINKTIKEIAYSLVRNAIRIQISPKDPVSKNVDHFVAFIEMDDKRFFLERIIRDNPQKKILAFVRTKVRAERLSAAMERANINALTLHGDKDQKDRLHVLNLFKQGKSKLLIATDVSARGIDVSNVQIVVNYDLPEQAENYVHRIGRTGRGNDRGQAISFCSKEELPLLESIEEYIGKEITVMEISKQEYIETIESTEEKNTDWKSLINNIEEFDLDNRKKGKSKKKK
jgi:ATP-dependent RNA helicase RhlE